MDNGKKYSEADQQEVYPYHLWIYNYYLYSNFSVMLQKAFIFTNKFE